MTLGDRARDPEASQGATGIGTHAQDHGFSPPVGVLELRPADVQAEVCLTIAEDS